MSEFGERSGFAVRLTDETYNIRMRGAQQRQAQALQEHKVAMLADDMKFNTPMNAYDRALAQKEGQDGASKLGNFVASNPGWETNVQARAMYNQLKDSITKGDNYTIGVLSDKAYKDWQTDLAEKQKNPDLFDEDSHREIAKQWDDYQRTGMYNGIRQPFQYVAPKDFVDLDAKAGDYGSTFGQFDVHGIKGGGAGSYQEVPNEKALAAVRDNFYELNKRQLERQAQQRGYANGQEYADALLRANIKTKRDYGQYRLSGDGSGSGKIKTPIVGNYTLDYVNKQQGNVNGEILDKAFGTKGQIRLTSNDGTTELDLTGNDYTHTGFHTDLEVIDKKGKKSNVKHNEFQMDLNEQQARDLGITYDPWGPGESEVNKEWKDKVEVITLSNKDGDKTRKIVRYRGLYPVPDVNNQTAQGIYDKASQISANVESPNDSYEQQQNVLSKSALISQGYTEKEIQEAINAGYNIQ